MQHTHMTGHNLHEIYQSAYRAHHSTESALLKVLNDVLTATEERKCVLLTFLDLSASFDIVDHNRFLDRLRGDFHVTGMAQKWLESYFMERYQAVCTYQLHTLSLCCASVDNWLPIRVS